MRYPPMFRVLEPNGKIVPFNTVCESNGTIDLYSAPVPLVCLWVPERFRNENSPAGFLFGQSLDGITPDNDEARAMLLALVRVAPIAQTRIDLKGIIR